MHATTEALAGTVTVHAVPTMAATAAKAAHVAIDCIPYTVKD